MKKLIFIGIVMMAIALIVVACTYGLRSGDYILWTNEVRYDELDGLHPIEENGLWGFICTATREMVIEPQFAWANRSSDGLAFVRGVEGREYQTGYIDLTGNLIIPLPMIYQGSQFSEGLAFVRGIEGEEGQTGYIDLTGNLAIPLPDGAILFGARFSEGLAFIRGVEGRDDLTGYIDLVGNLVIPIPTAIVAHDFSDGFAAIIKREWDYNEPALAVGLPGPYIFIDRAGQNVFGREFGSVGVFRDGLAIVTLDNGNSIFIDTKGQNAFRREFRAAFGFEGDYADVTLLNGSRVRINRSGRVVR